MPPLRRSDLEVRSLEGELVVLDLSRGRVHRLNATASLIWAGCDGRSTEADIAARVAAQFELPPVEVLDDVMRTIAEFRQLGLLVESTDDPFSSPQ
jgi:hypothetical protein